MDFDRSGVTDLSQQLFDEIWGSWNQCNDLSCGPNSPLGVRQHQQDGNGESGIKEVYDAEFKYLYEVPSHLVVHAPSARLNITRLVFCRNYRSYEPDSCKMRDGCKFVHADVDIRKLKAIPIHVNYVWSHEDLCTYERLPPGEVVEVLSSDMSSVESLPSGCILVTRGALARHETAEPLIRCKYFEANQICFTGERCNYIHVICVDSKVQGAFKRAPKVQTESNRTTTTSSCHPPQPNKSKVNMNNNNINHHLENQHSLRATASNWVPNAKTLPDEATGTSNLTSLLNNTFSFTPFTCSQVNSHPYAGMTGGMMNSGRPSLTTAFGSEPSIQTPSVSGDVSEQNLQDFLNACQATNNSTIANTRLQDAQTLTGGNKQFSSDVNDNGNGNGNGKTSITQEQLAGVLSQVVSLLAQHMVSPRSITVGMSPLLDDPHAVGTLLFLPRGGTEATPLQPVYDNSFLGVITALGLQQQRPVNFLTQQQPPPPPQQQQQQHVSAVPQSNPIQAARLPPKNILSLFSSVNGNPVPYGMMDGVNGGG